MFIWYYYYFLGFTGLPGPGLVNATVLTASGQPIQFAPSGLGGLGGPQKLIVTQHTPGGQPRLIVPAQLLSNGPNAAGASMRPMTASMTSAGSLHLTPEMVGGHHHNDFKKIEGLGEQHHQQHHPEIINPGRQILASQQLSLFPTSTLTERIETHKIISTPIGVSGTPIILQTAGALTSLQP